MIAFETPKHHWNYFLSIEKDVENLSRYIEFSSGNLKTYSIELSHILLSTSSEVDVIMRQLCLLINPSQEAANINDYRSIIQTNLPGLIGEEVLIPRYGLSFKPWACWEKEDNPIWWRSYNKVKHQRNDHFSKANLSNTLNALGALLIAVVYYYKLAFSVEAKKEIGFKETTGQLLPEAALFKINSDYYYQLLVV